MKKLTVTLRRSTNNANRKQVATVRALGLRKIGQSVQHDATDAILGMIDKVRHLVDVKEEGAS